MNPPQRMFAPAAALMLSAAAVLCGCQQPPKALTGDQRAAARGLLDTKEAGGLAVTLRLARRVFDVGETVGATVVAGNRTDTAMRFRAPTRAYCLLRVWYRSELGPWAVAKVYPRTALRAELPWTLGAGQRRTFELSLPVEPDWPTAVPLRLTAELNGVDAPVAELIVRVRPPGPPMPGP